MTTRTLLVQGDTLPEIVVPLVDQSVDSYGNTTTSPIDLTDTVAAVLKLRRKGVSALTDTIIGVVLAPPTSGRVKFTFTPLSLAGDAGNYEGEVELTQAGGGVFTVYEPLQFKVRKQF